MNTRYSSFQAVPEGIYGGRSDRHREAGVWQNVYLNNTFKGLRIVAEEYSLYYSVWCTNETEFFDLQVCATRAKTRENIANDGQSDPHQTLNIAASSKSRSAYQLSGRPLEHVLLRLNALIMVLKTCKGQTCTQPWASLHPDGSVNSLKLALQNRFDAFYESQPQMWFLECPAAYIAEVENQELVSAFAGVLNKQEAGFDWTRHWQYFT